jgi:hypothetical protein
MPDTYTYPETYILFNFINDLNASNLIWQYADTPQTMSFQGRYTLTNEAELLLLAKNCVAFNSINVKVPKAPYTGYEVLSDLLKQLSALLPTPTPAPAASSSYSALHLGDAAQVIGTSIVVASGAVIQGVQPATYSDSPVQFGQFVTIANELDASTKAVSAAATESIAQCVSDRLASEATINAAITANASTAASAVSSEASARAAADTSLQTQIDFHTAKLDIITASPDILQSFNGVKDFVDKLKADEDASLTSAVVILTKSIGDEATRAKSAEASLQTSLDSNVADLKATHAAAVLALQTAVAAEKGQRLVNDTIQQSAISTLSKKMDAILLALYQTKQPSIPSFPPAVTKSFVFPDGSHTELYRGIVDVLSTANLPMSADILAALPPPLADITATVQVTDSWRFDDPQLDYRRAKFKSYAWSADGSSVKLFFEDATRPGWGIDFFGQPVSGQAYSIVV